MKLANQGVRQKGKPINAQAHTLSSGDKFISLRFPNKPEELVIPEGAVGIVHNDAENEISIVRDDSQAARRWATRMQQTNKKLHADSNEQKVSH
jgi:hypothetical protein